MNTLWKTLCLAAAGSLCLFGAAPGATAQQAARPLYILVDGSGSMAAAWDGGATRSRAAAAAITQYLSAEPAARPASLYVFGGEGAQCGVPSERVALAPLSATRTEIQSALARVSPQGPSPLVAGVEAILSQIGDEDADLLIATDGVDTCRRNLCELSASVGRNVRISILPLGASAEIVDQFSCLTSVGADAPTALPRIVTSSAADAPNTAAAEAESCVFCQSFVRIPQDATLWSVLDSQVVSWAIIAILGLIATRMFKRFEKKIEKQVEEVREDATSNQDALVYDQRARDEERGIEEELGEFDRAGAEQGGGQNFRTETRDLVEKAKKQLERIMESDPDGRYKRTYDKLRRHDYTVIATALFERGRLGEEAYGAAMRIFTLWKSWGRGRAANKPISQQMLDYVRGQFKTLSTEEGDRR